MVVRSQTLNDPVLERRALVSPSPSPSSSPSPSPSPIGHRALAVLLVCGLACGLAGSLAGVAYAEPAPANARDRTPDYYAAVGVRAGANDPTSLVIAGKARLLQLGKPSVSGRAALLYGTYLEGRAGLTLEMELLPRLSPFMGVGVAYGTDWLGAWDPMLTGGVDIAIVPRLSLNITLNYVFQLAANDDDKEIMGGLALVF